MRTAIVERNGVLCDPDSYSVTSQGAIRFVGGIPANDVVVRYIYDERGELADFEAFSTLQTAPGNTLLYKLLLAREFTEAERSVLRGWLPHINTEQRKAMHGL